MTPTKLTRRETQVLRLLADGNSYRQIADQAGISINTVATHVKKLYLKLDVHTAAGAVMRGVQLRLLTADATWIEDLLRRHP